MTRTEEVMRELHRQINFAVEAGLLPPCERDVNTFQRVAPWSYDGLSGEVGMALFDGQGEADAERSGPADYEMVHVAEIEFVVFGADATALFDYILETLGALIVNLDPDAWDFIECRAPQRDYPASETHDLGKAATLPIAITFRSERPF